MIDENKATYIEDFAEELCALMKKYDAYLCFDAGEEEVTVWAQRLNQKHFINQTKFGELTHDDLQN